MANVCRVLGARGVHGEQWTCWRGGSGTGLRRTAGVVGRWVLGVQPPRPAGSGLHKPLPQHPAPDLGAGGRGRCLEQAGLRWVTAVCGTASGEGAGECE